MAFYCRRSRALLHTSCQPGIDQCVSLCRKVFVSVYPPTLWRRPSIVELDSCQKSVGGENDSKVLLTEKMLWETVLCCSLIVKELLRHGWRNICADLFGCCHCLQLLVASSPQRLSHVSFTASSSEDADWLWQLQKAKSNWKQSWRLASGVCGKSEFKNF